MLASWDELNIIQQESGGGGGASAELTDLQKTMFKESEFAPWVTDPKTEKSNRTITLPDFLAAEMRQYIDSLYGIQTDERIFPFTRSFLHHEMDRGCRLSGVKRIRVHDLRHSAISLLIDMGFSPLAIADRVGHEAIEITYNYTHLFPSKQQEMAKHLSQAMHEKTELSDDTCTASTKAKEGSAA